MILFFFVTSLVPHSTQKLSVLLQSLVCFLFQSAGEMQNVYSTLTSENLGNNVGCVYIAQ